MKKILFLIASDKPVPAIMGGAVETLCQNIIEKNEIEKKFEFHFLTLYSPKIDYNKYKYTKFYKIPRFFNSVNNVYWKLVGFIRKIFHFEILAPFQRIYEYLFLKYNYKNYDYIIEETDLKVFKRLTKINIRNNLIYHLHYSGEPTIENDKSFSYLLPISKYIGNNWKEKTGRDNQKIIEFINCIDVKKFQKEITKEEVDDLKKKLGINNDDIVFLFVGRIIPQKGVIELLETFHNIKEKKIKLILIGSSNFENKEITEYEKKINKYYISLKEKVIRLGYVKNDDIYKYQAISDFSIVPSIWNEPAGLVVLESQASGLPVIASNIGGIPQFICPNAGKLVDVNEDFTVNLKKAIEEMINLYRKNSEEYKEVVQKSKDWANKFNSTTYYNNFVNIIENIEKEKKKIGKEKD